MRKIILSCIWLVIGVAIIIGHGDYTYAAEKEQRFLEGIFLEEIDLSGLTQSEASQIIEKCIEQISESNIVIKDKVDNEIQIQIEEIGTEWINKEILEEAIEYGRSGNIIQRYKEQSDLENVGAILYPLEIAYNESKIREFIELDAEIFIVDKKDASLTRVENEFVYVEGNSGYSLDVDSTIEMVYETLLDKYRGGDLVFEAVLFEEDPLGSEYELSQVKDMIGTYTTAYTTSSSGRVKNIGVATNAINGTILYPGEEYSTRGAMLPFNASKGYELGGSYMDGVLVESYGGGVCQVSTTLYNALLMAELEITERHNHSMTVSYVPRAQDAAVSDGGLDLKFVNNFDFPIYIEGYNTSDKRCTFNIYGVETRSENRKVVLESEITEIISPGADVITPVAQGIGYVAVSSGYTGYRSRLWKLIYEDGVLVEREQMNSSNYKAVARSASVGVNSDNPMAVAEVNAAISTGSIDHVQNIVAAWVAAFAFAEQTNVVP